MVYTLHQYMFEIEKNLIDLHEFIFHNDNKTLEDGCAAIQKIVAWCAYLDRERGEITDEQFIESLEKGVGNVEGAAYCAWIRKVISEVKYKELVDASRLNKLKQ